MEDLLILVDKHDKPRGTMPKMQAHQLGELHRAFSIFLFNQQGQLLIQQRAFHKYHSAGQWANSCCSHPKPTELTLDAANRRLGEELNITSNLIHIGEFIYQSEVNGGLIEHEYDHIYIGLFDDLISPNFQEVAATRWIDIKSLYDEIKNNPQNYTEWLKIILTHYSASTIENWFSQLQTPIQI